MKETIEKDLSIKMECINQRIDNMAKCFKDIQITIKSMQSLACMMTDADLSLNDRISKLENKIIESESISQTNTNIISNNTEYWYDIEGWEGYYQISSLGRVKSLPRILKGRNNNIYRIPTERIMKIFKTKYDIYPYVIFSKDSEKYKVYIKDIKIKNT